MWKLSKKSNSLYLSDTFVKFLKNRYLLKGISFSQLFFPIGDGLELAVHLRIFKKKGVLNEV